MLPMQEIIKRIRSQTHDIEEIGWADEEILNVINAGYRFVARIIKADKPELIAEEPIQGTLEARQNIIELPSMADVVISVVANNKRLPPISRTCITYDDDRAREPIAYYLRGFNKIVIYPTPTEPIDYQIEYVADSNTEFELEDSSTLPTDFDDAIIEYAVIRLSMANEFDMSQETTLMATIVQQIEELLRNYDIGNNHIVQGYWDGYDGIPINIHRFNNED